jgi:hypothetical protein
MPGGGLLLGILLGVLGSSTAASDASSCAAPVADPVDCSAGNGASLTATLCAARGCCWHPSPSGDGDAVESGEAGCIAGVANTPKGGVKGSNTWKAPVEFPGGQINDGDPVAAEIQGYVHAGKAGGPGPCCGNTFALSTANITERGFDLVVTRTGKLSGQAGWGQELLIAWKAGTKSCKFPPGPHPHPGPPPPPEAKSQCFYPKTGSPVEVVHMINSNHFDAGYADWTSKVLNEYFHKYFPQAARVGEELKQQTGMPLRWMTFSYIVSLFLDCPANYGVLECPTPEEVANFTAAVKAGHIVFPAFPTNAELALADPSILSFGVQLSKDIASSLGMDNAPAVVSTRDVPGMPRSSIPILKAAGVHALSEGMNGRMVAVNAPPVFSWKDEASAESMLTLWHFGGYGSVGDKDWLIRIPGSNHALAYCWRGDNAGPPGSSAEVLKNVASVRAHPMMAQYPQAQVITSTLENVTAQWIDDGAMAEGSGNLPVVTKELSDTWIWGAGSDPVKVAQMRAIHRLRTSCEAAGQCKPALGADPAYYNFSRQLQKNLEHTWGISVFHYGNLQNSNWTNEEFHADLAANNSNLDYFVQSWIEQRNYGVHYPLEALTQGGHPLAAKIEAEFIRMEPTIPATAGLKAIPKAGLGAKMKLGAGGWCELQLDTSTGAVVHLAKAGATSLAAPASPLLLVRYQTLVEADFLAWQKEYIIPGSGGGNEFGKPSGFMTGSDGKPIKKFLAAPTLRGAWTDKTADATKLLLALDFDADLHLNYGAPASAWLELDITTPGRVGASLTLQNKTATRLPEAAWVSFTPAGAGGAGSSWSMDKLGEAVSPLDVADGASKGLHAVLSGVNFTSSTGTKAFFESLDSPVVRWDKPAPFPTPLHAQPDLSYGASYLLFDNIWVRPTTVTYCMLGRVSSWLPLFALPFSTAGAFTVCD